MDAHGLTYRHRRAFRNEGFSLMEFLLAAFILGVGLLGLAALQAMAARQGTSSRERGTATFLAHNLLDRIAAEGQLSAGERMMSPTGTVTSTGYLYVDPISFSAGASSADALTFDISGNAVPATDPSKIFSVSWQRMAGASAGPYNATAEFIVNVQWNELARTPGGVAVVIPKYFSVSRNVRL